MHKRWRLLALLVGLAVMAPAVAWGWRALDSWRFESALKETKATLVGGSRQRSRDALAALAERWPGRGEVEFLLGAAEQSLGHLDAADRAWRRVPSASTFSAPSAMFRARLALRGDRFAEAEGPLIEALRGKGALAIEARETLVSLYKSRDVTARPGRWSWAAGAPTPTPRACSGSWNGSARATRWRSPRCGRRWRRRPRTPPTTTGSG